MAALNYEEIESRRKTFGLFLRPKKIGLEDNSLKKRQVESKPKQQKKKGNKVKLKGRIYTKELWSDTYYMQVMKLANLQQIDNFFTRAKRQKIYERQALGRNGIHLQYQENSERLPRINIVREYFNLEDDSTYRNKSEKRKKSLIESIQNRSLNQFIGECDSFIKDSSEIRSEIQEQSKNLLSNSQMRSVKNKQEEHKQNLKEFINQQIQIRKRQQKGERAERQNQN